ncbi:SKI/DACH domain-containing protein 1 [Brachyhypopomus gauderio]|uniref:SKI/DACH domain-containing protein 1 n=1 Tax=Brachyhypopomus gauderio TaxID=698409 RepID=UPI004041A805
MGDLEFGFEEMQGVKLGYLVIKGKQMFALSQVFTDLLKNIPRTTVHKRMDHLNVKKHHCDLEELRKLKAINSIAFHAAKCTLISREDVEALYFSCKTERVLKSNKRRTKTKPPEHLRDDKTHTEARNGFWKEKVWLSLRGVPQTLTLKNKAVRQDVASGAHNLPQIYSKSFRRDFQPVTTSACKPFKNYETVQIPGDCVAFNQKHSFFRNVVHRHPVFCQSAIAAQPRHPGTVDLLYKRRRKRESARRHFWSRNGRCRQVLLVPKCCKPKVPNGSLRPFHPEHERYAEPRHVQESCSSDTESSSVSERLNNDSDFGSSLSTTTNSGTSDEEEDESPSCSSDDSSDEESSSQSDSSSVSSQVSTQSIRFRRAGFSNLNTKSPLVLQPTFHYRPNLQHKSGIHGTMAALDCERAINFQKLDIATWRHMCRDGDASNVRKLCTVGNSFSGLRRDATPETVLQLDFSNDPKTADHVSSRIKDMGFTSGTDRKVFPQQRAPGHSKKCYQVLVPHCTQDEDTAISKPPDHFSVAANSKKDVNVANCHKLPSPLKTIKREAVESSTVENSHNESNTTGKTAAFPLNNVKIKVEDPFDEYEYASQGPGHQCKGNDVYGLYISENIEADHCEAASETTPLPSNQESSSTLNTHCAHKGEYRNGTRVRKNCRAPILGKKTENAGTPVKSTTKVDGSPRAAEKCASFECSSEDGARANKRKRAANNPPSLQKPFDFMANFPSPPSLIVGSDGDLSPAYTLSSFRDARPPHRSHPVWRWRLGRSVVPPPPNQRSRKTLP